MIDGFFYYFQVLLHKKQNLKTNSHPMEDPESVREHYSFRSEKEQELPRNQAAPAITKCMRIYTDIHCKKRKQTE